MIARAAALRPIGKRDKLGRLMPGPTKAPKNTLTVAEYLKLRCLIRRAMKRGRRIYSPGPCGAWIIDKV